MVNFKMHLGVFLCPFILNTPYSHWPVSLHNASIKPAAQLVVVEILISTSGLKQT